MRGSFARLVLFRPDIGRLPQQVLAPVERDHLASHGWRAQDEKHRIRNFLRRGAMAQGHGPALLLEFSLALIDAAEGWPWADRVHADARRQRLGHGPGGCPERGFAERVGKEMRVWPQHAADL